MYVVVVEFSVPAPRAGAFHERVLQQARDTRRLESGCHQFDVCVDPGRPGLVFLYEVYSDRQAFETHLASSHFAAFDAAVGGWIDSKKITTYERLESGA